jgi:hypothetical protein
MTPQRSDSGQPRTANDNTGDSLRDGMAAAYNRGLADGRAEAGAASPSEPLREALDALLRFIAFEDMGTGRARPMYITANGVLQEMPARLRDDAWRVRAALAAPSQEPQPDMEER